MFNGQFLCKFPMRRCSQQSQWTNMQLPRGMRQRFLRWWSVLWSIMYCHLFLLYFGNLSIQSYLSIFLYKLLNLAAQDYSISLHRITQSCCTRLLNPVAQDYSILLCTNYSISLHKITQSRSAQNYSIYITCCAQITQSRSNYSISLLCTNYSIYLSISNIFIYQHIFFIVYFP